MPALPNGERPLHDLALAFAEVEGKVIAWLADAAVGDAKRALRLALEALTGLRLRNHRPLVAAAYLHANPNGNPNAVKDLAGSLTRKLDTGLIVASDGARHAYRTVTTDTLEDAAVNAVTAHIDKTGTRWPLSAYAAMTTTTIGRTATSRGVTDRVGEGNTVTVHVGQCSYCQTFAGEAVVGTDPTPPFHPSCSCVLSA